MRIQFSHLVALLPLLIGGCSRPEAPAELHWRLVGSTALQSQTNAPALAEALRIPEAGAVTGPLAMRLAEVLWHLGTSGKPLPPTEAATGAALMPDLLRQASIGEIVLNPKGGHDFVIALQGLGGGTAAWEKQWVAWATAMHVARGSGGSPETVHKDGWLIAVSDGNLVAPANAWKRLQSFTAEPGALVQFDLRYPGRVNLQASMTARDGFARWNAKATLAKPLPARLPAWEMPSAIHEPLVLFTALRGIPELADSLPFLRNWAGKALPSELFIWGQPGNPHSGHTYFAGLMDDPKAAVEDLNRRFTPWFDPSSPARFRGKLTYDPAPPRLVMSGALPIVPTFEAQKDGDHNFLTFGFIPQIRTTNALSPEMLAQLNRTNLLYYDWEITANSALHWHLMGQMHDLLEGRHAIVTNAAIVWTLATVPKLGETVTEVLVTDPNTVTIRRKSPLGLSGIELAALTKWIDPTPPFRRVLPVRTNTPAASASPGRKSP